MSFSIFDLNKPILDALKAKGYVTPTPIQTKAIPEILSCRDVLASAQTGTGKTAASNIPLFNI